jgi:hypothetical protein
MHEIFWPFLLILPDATCHVLSYNISYILLDVAIKHPSVKTRLIKKTFFLAQLAKDHVVICQHLASVRPSSVVRRKTFTLKYSPLNSLSKITPHLASSIKQHSAGRHVAPLERIILIPRQSIVALTSKCWVLRGETANENAIVFDVAQLGLEHTIYRSRGEHTNHDTTDSVLSILT